ncbi:YchJ family protein [filamentous cyanobacterium LEGE 11480]|uniref:UPF0225 protein IQ266_00520 n=2 Tax=Romeriopsis TaxID=2992131 RepID=A0A928VKV7_9CYAN|nr:YchJ family protein [Romeriopsis navalis LEGE 11480]
MSAPNPCPCGSNKLYTECCEPYHTGVAVAPTAEALMRSRYSAFCKRDIDYIVRTRHASTRKNDDRRSLRQTFNLTHWIGLTILKTQKGQPKDKKGVVEYVAECRDTQAQGFNVEVKQLHEKSRFVKEDDQWFYVGGELLPPVKLPGKKAPKK